MSPLRYCSEPNLTLLRSRLSNEGSGRAWTSIETGVVTENSSGFAAFGGRSSAVCADATAGSTSAENPAAVDFRKRRRLRLLDIEGSVVLFSRN
jgi:hypothetical protein